MTALAGFRHEAAVYRGDRGFLDVTLDYVRDGLVAGQPVIVAVIPPRIELMRSALGPDADQVRFVDMAEVGRNPARIIPLWREVVEAAGGAPIRGIGEPVWHGRRPAELAEALLHEALLNIAFADGPDLLLRCPYDAQALGEEMIGHAHRRHPAIVNGTIERPLEPVLTAEEFRLPLPETNGRWQPEVFEYDEMPAVRTLRAVVGERAVEVGIDPDRAGDLKLAVHEVAVNSLRHGGGRGRLRIWFDGVALVCEISDAGHIDQPLVGRIRPTPTQLSGRGVWLANQLCDLVQVRSSPAGTTIRLHMLR